MKKNIKGVLFDFNGTMVFDGEEHKQAWDAFSRKYRNCPITDKELEQMHGKTNKAIISLLLKGKVEEKQSEQLSRDKEALYRDICHKEKEAYHLVNGLTAVLDELKAKHIPMTICSASIQENIAFFIDKFCLERWFSIADIVYDNGTHIDKVSMFHEGAKNIGVAIEDCLIIEDSLSGLRCAKKVNAASIIAITTPNKTAFYQKLSKVEHIIYDYEEVDLKDWYHFIID